MLDEGPETDTFEQRIAGDAARLYDQGWTIRQVAARFGCSYGVMRRILRTQVRLRNRGGSPRGLPAGGGAP
ncbi:helix-turn-helix domain-containing protein [Actinomadura sp. DC4]|nr:helix-turn-helix domain-containing protein [Actinomadura sp. DC4]MDN3357909.1 helix-turn-helix domain-containing protein [Actinomadura sp. DC4]